MYSGWTSTPRSLSVGFSAGPRSFFFDKAWLDDAAYEVTGSVLVAEVGWVGSFSSLDEGVDAQIARLDRSNTPVPVILKPFGSHVLLYGEAIVRKGAAGAVDVTTAVLTGAPGSYLTTQPPS